MMGDNSSYNEWIDARTLEYCDAVEDLLEPLLEDHLDRQTLTDLIFSVITLGTTYMEDVVAKIGNELVNRTISELKRGGE